MQLQGGARGARAGEVARRPRTHTAHRLLQRQTRDAAMHGQTHPRLARLTPQHNDRVRTAGDRGQPVAAEEEEGPVAAEEGLHGACKRRTSQGHKEERPVAAEEEEGLHVAFLSFTLQSRPRGPP